MNYTAQLAALHNAVVHGASQPMLEEIKPARANTVAPASRLAVYRDGYMERLINAVMADYPALTHFMGRDALVMAVRAFVNAQPSQWWDLNQYPVRFASFFSATHKDAQAIAIAQLESAIAEVFWMEESAALEPATLATQAESGLEYLQFIPRRAARLLALACAANDYLQAFRNGAQTMAMEEQPEYIMVVRHHNEVRRVMLESSEYLLLKTLIEGTALGDALEAVNDETMAEKLPLYIARWLEYGFFTDLRPLQAVTSP